MSAHGRSRPLKRLWASPASAWPVGNPVPCDCCGKNYQGKHAMAVTQQKSDKRLAVTDSSVPWHRSKTTTGVKVKGRGFARPTKASKSKHVTTQEMLSDVTKFEGVVTLKNLAKLLVDRIEAACAARYATSAIPPPGHSQIPNPKGNLNSAPPPRLLHGPDPGTDADQEVRNEYGSHLGFDESCAVSTEKAQPHSPHTPQLSGKPGDGTLHHGSRRKSCPRSQANSKENLNTDQPSRLRLGTTDSGRITNQEVINFCQSHAYGTNLDNRFCQSIQGTNNSVQSDGTLNHSTSSIWETHGSCSPSLRPSGDEATCQFLQEIHTSVQNDGTLNNSSSIWGASESCTPNSRPRSQPNPGDTSEAYEGSEPMRTVASLSSRMLTLKKVNVGLDNCEIKPPKKEVHPKMRSPGLRSLVVPQLKSSQPPAPAQRPANTKLILSSSKPMQERGEVAKGKEERMKNSEPKELYEPVWADVLQSVFDEVFGDQGTQPSCAGNKKQRGHQLSRPPRGTEEWIIQTQSIQYSYSTEEGAKRGVHNPPNADKRFSSAPPMSREPPDPTEHSTRSKEEPNCRRPPVILPTLAKYHMDKIERYKKCVAEKQLRDSRWLQQECCRPSTAPDPYNVLNVYAERFAAQKKCHRPLVQKASERVPSNMDEMDRPCGKPFSLRQETRGATNLPREQSRSELKARNPDVKDRTPREKELLQGSRDDLLAQQETANCTEAVSKQTRFRDHWPVLDRLIEGFIQGHILQCCILFKNIPPIFPKLEYQEEIQRLYGGHPLSTR